jgi:hypothetical protein
MRSLVSLVVVLLTVGFFVETVAGQTAGTHPGALFAAVERDGSVSLRDAAGRNVARTRAGVYVITVRDRSQKYSFRFNGPAGIVRRASGKRFSGVVRWRVRLHPATYEYSSTRVRRTLRVV